MDCGLVIGFPRLSAEPWALRCITCQSQLEQAFAHAPR